MTAGPVEDHSSDAVPRSPEGRVLGTRGEQTRRRLLEAAEEVFGRYGYQDASIVKITQVAGVAQGTFYNYFSSKQQIFAELVLDLNRRVRRALRAASADAPTRVEQERRGFQAFFEFTAQHPALYRIIRQAESAAPETLHEHYRRIVAPYSAGLQRAMDAGEIARGDPHVLAWILMGIAEIVGMNWVLWRDTREVPAAVVDELARFVARGLGAAGVEESST